MGVSQKLLAKRVSLSQSYISELENGRKVASPSTWSRLVFHLDDNFEGSPGITFEEAVSQVDELARGLLRGEPWIIYSFLDRFSADLRLHFHCPTCNQLRTFKCRAIEPIVSFTPRGQVVKDEEYRIRLTCAFCLEKRRHKSGGYVIAWRGRGRFRTVLLMAPDAQAKVSLVHWSDF